MIKYQLLDNSIFQIRRPKKSGTLEVYSFTIKKRKYKIKVRRYYKYRGKRKWKLIIQYKYRRKRTYRLLHKAPFNRKSFYFVARYYFDKVYDRRINWFYRIS